MSKRSCAVLFLVPWLALAACDDELPPLPDTNVDTQVADSQTDSPPPDSPPPDSQPPDTAGESPTLDLAPDTTPDLASDKGIVKPDKGPLDVGLLDSSPLSASITDEKWYQGSVVCTSEVMLLSELNGTLVVHLNQIPAASVPGTCSGHAVDATLFGQIIALDITKTGGGACWTACWDFVVEISGLPSGSYTVKYLGLSKTIQLP